MRMTVLSVRNSPEVVLEITVKQNATLVLFLGPFSLHVFLLYVVQCEVRLKSYH